MVTSVCLGGTVMITLLTVLLFVLRGVLVVVVVVPGKVSVEGTLPAPTVVSASSSSPMMRAAVLGSIFGRGISDAGVVATCPLVPKR